jgi:hypothetical protein
LLRFLWGRIEFSAVGFRSWRGGPGTTFATDRSELAVDERTGFLWIPSSRLPKIFFITAANDRRADLRLFRTHLSRELGAGVLSSAALYLSIQSCSASVNGVRFTSMGRPDLERFYVFKLYTLAP